MRPYPSVSDAEVCCHPATNFQTTWKLIEPIKAHQSQELHVFPDKKILDDIEGYSELWEFLVSGATACRNLSCRT